MSFESALRVVDVIKDGGIVLFPTETVYGIGTAIDNIKGIERLYNIKGRDRKKPLALHVGSYAVIYEFAMVDDRVDDFIKRFLPGPYTLVLPSRDESIGTTVGVRFPALPFLMDALKKVKGVWGTSANLSGDVAPCSFDEVRKEILESVDIAVDGGSTYYRDASTVIDFTGKEVKVLRRGAGVVPWL